MWHAISSRPFVLSQTHRNTLIGILAVLAALLVAWISVQIGIAMVVGAVGVAGGAGAVVRLGSWIERMIHRLFSSQSGFQRAGARAAWCVRTGKYLMATGMVIYGVQSDFSATYFGRHGWIHDQVARMYWTIPGVMGGSIGIALTVATVAGVMVVPVTFVAVYINSPKMLQTQLRLAFPMLSQAMAPP